MRLTPTRLLPVLDTLRGELEGRANLPWRIHRPNFEEFVHGVIFVCGIRSTTSCLTTSPATIL